LKNHYIQQMLSLEGYHTYYIYIITNKSKTVFYTGVTNNLKIRLVQHKENISGEKKVLLQSIMLSSYYTMKNLLGFKKQSPVKKK
jgi:predicted GIY-YIG superfamily endonuclease